MGDIVNLRRERKRRARQDKESEAQQNRISFGRTKVEKQLGAAEQDQASRLLDNHKRERLDD